MHSMFSRVVNVAAVAAIGLCFTWSARASWTYDASTKVITSDEWELYTNGSSDGLTVTGVKTPGGGVLDL